MQPDENSREKIRELRNIDRKREAASAQASSNKAKSAANAFCFSEENIEKMVNGQFNLASIAEIRGLLGQKLDKLDRKNNKQL